MQIRFLGTGDAFCSGGRYQTCFLVELSGYSFLLDCGATSLLALNQSGIDTSSIESIIISHFHGDHFGGVPFLLLDANFNKNRTKPLSIVGPGGVSQRVGELLDQMYPKVTTDKFSFEVNFSEYSTDDEIQLGPVGITSFPVVHVPESSPHGLRISTQDKTLAFSGDTGWTENLFPIADAADLFICECNFYRTVSPSHLNYQTLIKQRDNLKCQKMILNHLGPEMLRNMERVDLPCSHDGLVLNL